MPRLESKYFSKLLVIMSLLIDLSDNGVVGLLDMVLQSFISDL